MAGYKAPGYFRGVIGLYFHAYLFVFRTVTLIALALLTVT